MNNSTVLRFLLFPESGEKAYPNQPGWAHLFLFGAGLVNVLVITLFIGSKGFDNALWWLGSAVLIGLYPLLAVIYSAILKFALPRLRFGEIYTGFGTAGSIPALFQSLIILPILTVNAQAATWIAFALVIAVTVWFFIRLGTVTRILTGFQKHVTIAALIAFAVIALLLLRWVVIIFVFLMTDTGMIDVAPPALS